MFALSARGGDIVQQMQYAKGVDPLTPERFNVGEENHVTNATVINRASNQHGISGYLSDEKVAEVIYEALTRE